jgi:hypothetical protein
VSTPNNEQLRPAFNRTDATDALFDQWMALQELGKGYIQLWERLDRRLASIGSEDEIDKLQKVVEMAQARNDAGDNIYVTPNPMNTRDKRGKDQVVAFVECYVDVDCGKQGISIDVVMARALSFDIKPSLALMSGNGVQLRYRVCFENRADWQSVQDGLFSAFEDLGADAGVRTDESRLLKLPGSVASKSGEDGYEPRATEVLHTSDERITADRMLSVFGKKSSSGIVAKADASYERQTFTVEDAARQGRQVTLYKFVTSLRGRGYDLEDAMKLAALKAEEIGYGDDDDHRETPEDMTKRVYRTYEQNERTARVEVSHRADDREVFAATGDDIFMAEIERPEWVWPGFARGTYNVSPAEPNAGKTSFFLTASVRTVIGNPMFDQACPWNTPEFSVYSEFDTENAPAVIYVVGEDTWEWAGSDIQTIYKNAFNVPDDHIRRALRDRLLFYIPKRGYRKFDFCNPLDQDRIRRDGERITNGFKRPLIVIADTLTATHTLPDGASLAADHHVKNYITEPAVMLAGDTNGVVIHLCHVPKGTGRKSREGSKSERAQLAKNSGQIWGAARTVADLAVMREKTPEHNLISRFGLPKEKGCTVRDFQIEIDSETRAITWNNEEIKSAGQENYARLREIIDLNPDGISRQALLLKSSLAEATMDRYLNFGVEEGHFRKKQEGRRMLYLPRESDN